MGVARRELIVAAMTSCQKRLEAMGFTRHGETFTLPLSQNLYGWAALGRATHRGDGSMEITPYIGLLHQKVERLVATIINVPYHRFSSSTVHINAGLLTPEGRGWRVTFLPNQLVDEPAELVCRPIHNYGIPWVREHASLAAIYELANTSQFTVALRVFKVPVIAYLLGRPDLAQEHMHAHLIHIKEEVGPNVEGALEVYARFATALELHMSDSNNPPKEVNGI